jgi:peroxiredoxin
VHAREANLKKSNSVASPPAHETAEPESLGDRLSAYREQSSRFKPDLARAYDELVERLTALDRGEVGPRTGEPMPPFALPDETGRLVSLASMLRTGPVVVSINRGHWCPYCKMELRSLAAIHGETRRLGAHIVSIMPDPAQFTGDYVARNQLPFPVLSDIDLGYSLSLGLIFWVGAEIRRLYEETGVELETYHGNRGHFLPMAAKFIVGRDGLVKARQVNIEFRRRMEPEAILAELNALRGA